MRTPIGSSISSDGTCSLNLSMYFRSVINLYFLQGSCMVSYLVIICVNCNGSILRAESMLLNH